MKSGYSGMTKGETRDWKKNISYKEQLDFDMCDMDDCGEDCECCCCKDCCEKHEND